MNKQLSDQGIMTIAEKPTPMENWITFLNKGTPIGILADVVKPVATGIGDFFGGPSVIVLIIGAAIVAVIVLPMIFRK